MLRKVIEIDEELCNGCGVCVPSCQEGALRIIDGKARLISDLFCDGLGACIGDCPEGAIRVIEREAEPYNEIMVLDSMLEKPRSVLKAHLLHLKEHGADEYLSIGIEYLKSKGIVVPLDEPKAESPVPCACPGSLSREIKRLEDLPQKQQTKQSSRLTQWPVQLHLVSPFAPYFKNKELVIMSTCAPVANANVHDEYIKDRSLVVACPKLDITDPDVGKLSQIYSESNTPRVIVVRMEVPCCGGLSSMAVAAARQSGRQELEIVEHVIAIDGSFIKSNILFKN